VPQPWFAALEWLMLSQSPASRWATDWQAFDDSVTAADGPRCVLKDRRVPTTMITLMRAARNRYPALRFTFSVGTLSGDGSEGPVGAKTRHRRFDAPLRWLVGKSRRTGGSPPRSAATARVLAGAADAASDSLTQRCRRNDGRLHGLAMISSCLGGSH